MCVIIAEFGDTNVQLGENSQNYICLNYLNIIGLNMISCCNRRANTLFPTYVCMECRSTGILFVKGFISPVFGLQPKTTALSFKGHL